MRCYALGGYGTEGQQQKGRSMSGVQEQKREGRVKIQTLVGDVQEYRTSYEEGREVKRGGRKRDADTFWIV